MHRSTKTDTLSRLIRLTPLIFVVVGTVLIIIGNTATLKGCKIAGPVVITVGGLLLLFLTVWSSCKPRHTEENTICEEAMRYANRNVLGEGSNDQQGPIHHFEFKTPSTKYSCEEEVPPSYEEAVTNNTTETLESSQSGKVLTCDGAELNSDCMDVPPPYEESHVNAK